MIPQKVNIYLQDPLGNNSYRDTCILLDTAVADFAGTMESTAAAVVVWRTSPALMAETARPGMHPKGSNYQFVKAKLTIETIALKENSSMYTYRTRGNLTPSKLTGNIQIPDGPMY